MPDENDIVYNAYSIDFLALARAIYDLFTGGGGGGGAGAESGFDAIIGMFSTLWTIWTVLAYLISFLLVYGIIYAYVRDNELSAQEELWIKEQEDAFRKLHVGSASNVQWQEIEQHIGTDDPNDWKLAIIEADIMLEKMLADQGFAGNTVADKLRSASPQSFATLEDAWTAHKVRNKVAHGSEDFVLTSKIARETITQYRRVFQEFGII